MDYQLRGRTAVITGGSEGIGYAVAQALAAEGVNLILAARGEERLRARSEALGAAAVVADVSSLDGTTAVIDAVRAAGGADILINNAGTGSNETILSAPDSEWQRYWDLHVMAAVRLSRGIAPMMKHRGGGVILNNASICARQPLGYEPIYNVTKAALMMFSKCLANELIPDNIRVNCINPGLILTPDWENTARKLTTGTNQTPEEYLDAIARKNAPIGRFASPAELAHFFVFLCSPLASYCTGSTYQVDGGWLNVAA
ncbi:MAG: SDR family oxidoreductase [Acidobacteria bacterium]|nr:SDR family oxidoreductase [Acidobacteriota bacterium]